MDNHQNKFQAHPWNGSGFIAVLSFVCTRLALWLGWRNFLEFLGFRDFSIWLQNDCFEEESLPKNDERQFEAEPGTLDRIQRTE